MVSIATDEPAALEAVLGALVAAAAGVVFAPELDPQAAAASTIAATGMATRTTGDPSIRWAYMTGFLSLRPQRKCLAPGKTPVTQHLFNAEM